MHSYCSDLKKIFGNKVYTAAVLLIALLCYGFAAFNTSVSLDDLEVERYVCNGGTLLTSGRFATVLWAQLLGYSHDLPLNSTAIDILSVLMLVFSAANFSILFRRISAEKISLGACTVFSCLLISYPLMNEIWEYTGANLNVCVGFLLASFSLLSVYDFLETDGKKQWYRLIPSALMMMLVCAGYESIVPVYVFMVFAVLALQAVYGKTENKKLRVMILHGLVYAAVLAAGLLLRIIVHRGILLFTGLEAGTNGATEIRWLLYPVSYIVKYLIADFARHYVLKGIIYLPLTELVVAGVVFIVFGIFVCRKHGRSLLLPGFGMLLSLILLSLVQGVWSPYRTCQVFAVFVAFTVLIVLTWLQNAELKRMKWCKPVAFSLAAFLCVYQSLYLNYFLTLNHHRSEEELHAARSIGADLEAFNEEEKPVIFVGKYTLSDYIQEAASIPEDSVRWQLYKKAYAGTYALMGETYDVSYLSRKLPMTNINSVIDWSVNNRFKQESMENLLNYCGFEYQKADYNAVYSEAVAYAAAENMPAYPQNGYICDAGAYVIVNIGG